jgi:hypothetical protein
MKPTDRLSFVSRSPAGLRAAAALCAALTLCIAALSGCGRTPGATGQIDMGLVKQIRNELGQGAGGGAASAATRGTPTGWATLKGRFVLDGAAPAMQPIVMLNNKDMCPPAKTETLVVGSGGGIRDMLIFLDDKIPDDSAEPQPLWTHASYNLSAAASAAAGELLPQQQPQVVFDQKECRFLDHVFAMRSNQLLLIKNSDPFGHNTNLKTQDAARPFDKTIPPGSSAVHEPGGAEGRPFPVSCAIHPWMSAKMIIRDNPYFFVTRDDGVFEIRNIPAGVDLEFRIWQEQSNFLKQIKIGGKPENLSSGRYKVNLDPDEVLDLGDVMIDLAQFQ